MSEVLARRMASENVADSIVAVVTGASGGLGKEIVRGLLADGVTVIAGVRSLDKGEALRAELSGIPGPGRIDIVPLDISDMRSVRAFAATVAEQHPTLQILINNAGAWFNERGETGEGRELTLATNVLGPYLLTKLLLPQLRASTRARIVNTVSAAVGDYDVTDLEWRNRRYGGFKAYRQSKQALQMVTESLALTLAGSGVVANAVSPGFVRTTFLKEAKGLVAAALRATSFLAVSPAEGAATPLWVALSPDLADVSGRLYENRKEKAVLSFDRANLERLTARLDELSGLK
ncbi:SDR family NAD(P)-dependent oxidoreductase [Sphingomonas sp. NFR15]|uniref:SDR family NAD(P)-dependent oxidoreductase n=1 Tax=Sphingomonas sp. NFR15 TaxID=1566282 RepID=UPI0008859BD1|nr:SDR family NAD(P)-dependent oxidoreductase [Sphingomonas sp. NFR15]SDA35837.1 NAD(P)-dependent dehydrogenase, short-chain alcohol dehydrogenase family [Sphingomonas sp. NFR15]